VEHGSPYPALHRLEDRGWIAFFRGTSGDNRKARYCRLTAPGRAQHRDTETGEMTRVREVFNFMNSLGFPEVLWQGSHYAVWALSKSP